MEDGHQHGGAHCETPRTCAIDGQTQARERKHTWGVAHVSQLTVPTTLVSANLERCREVVVRVGVGIVNIVGIGEDVR